MNKGLYKLTGLVIVFVFFMISVFRNEMERIVSTKVHVLDSTADIRKSSYISADYTDVGNGICYHSKTYIPPDNDFFWAFKIKGREDVVILTHLYSYSDYPMPGDVQMRYLVSQFHKKKFYRLLPKNKYTKNVRERLRSARYFIKDIDKVKILNLDEPFILNGAAVANRRVSAGRNNQRALTPAEKIRAMTDAALLGDYNCSYHIALIYNSYKKNAANRDSALVWFERTAQQTLGLWMKTDALKRMAYLYIDKGEYDKAAAAIDSAIIINPGDTALYNMREELLVVTDDRE